MMKKLSAVGMDRCIGCHSCSMACARLVHKQFSWINAGIHIHTSGGLSTGFEASVCLACNPAACAAVCPTGACVQRAGGGVKKNTKVCIRCGKCAAACPVEAVHVDPETSTPHVCIHCGHCVSYCPHDCLILQDIPGTEKREAPELTGDGTGDATC